MTLRIPLPRLALRGILRPHTSRPWLCAWILLASIVPVRAQAELVPSERAVRRVDSPMVVEAPLRIPGSKEPRGWSMIGDFAQYRCEGVSIRFVKYRLQSSGDHWHLTLVAQAYNEPGHDKLARIRFDLLSGDEILATALTREMDLEERDTESGSAELRFAAQQTPHDTDLRLRVTTTVWDN